METLTEPTSSAEHILVERSQDSVQVTKNRMQRRSLTPRQEDSSMKLDGASDSTAEGERCASQQADGRKAAKTRFSADPHKVQRDDNSKGRKSISKRISDALGFKKVNLEASSASIEHSAPSLHVKFQQTPEVIE